MSLNQLIKDQRKPWLTARVESLKVDGALESGSFTNAGDMTVQGNLTVEGDIIGQQDASLVGDLTANRVRVDASPSGGVNFLGVGTLDWYSMFTGTAPLQGTFIASNNPDVSYKLTRVGDIVNLYISGFSVPNADLAASGTVFVEFPGHANFAPPTPKTYPVVIQNSSTTVVSRANLYLPGPSSIGVSFYYDVTNPTFTKGANSLILEGFNIAFDFTQ